MPLIYLEDVDVANGRLHIVSGSPRQSIAIQEPDPFSRGKWTTIDKSKALDLIVPVGTVVLFSANLIRGAYNTNSPKTLSSTAWHYLPSDLHFGNYEGL